MNQEESQDKKEPMEKREEENTEEDRTVFLTTPRLGKRLGEYELLDKIGEGGMASVYKAYHPGLSVHRAIKILDPIHSKDEGFLKRFKREAKIAAQLKHSNIITVHTVEQKGDFHYIDMDYVDGENLNSIRNKDKKIPLPVSLLIGIEICKALDHAHTREFTYMGESLHSIVHRDIKPANIMVSKTGQVILTDFGIARAVKAPDVTTTTGRRFGTIAYMSPEQVDDKSIDHHTDIYSLGVVLYEILTGQKPFTGESTTAIIGKIIRGNYTRIQKKDPHLPIEIASIVTKAMELKPENRYQSAHEMQRDMEEALKSLFRVSDPIKEIQSYLKDKDNYQPPLPDGKRFKIEWSTIAIVAGLTIFIIGLGLYSMTEKKGSLTISSDLPGIQVTLDGRESFSSKNQYIFITAVSQGKHTIEVKLTSRDITPIKREIVITSPQELVEVKFLP